MKKKLHLLVLTALIAASTGYLQAAEADLEEEEADWVCFAYDFVDGHDKNDPETDDCIHSYHRGEGICLSHAKKAAMARCLQFSKNKSTCKPVKPSDDTPAKWENCFLMNEKPKTPKQASQR